MAGQSEPVGALPVEKRVVDRSILDTRIFRGPQKCVTRAEPLESLLVPPIIETSGAPTALPPEADRTPCKRPVIALASVPRTSGMSESESKRL